MQLNIELFKKLFGASKQIALSKIVYDMFHFLLLFYD